MTYSRVENSDLDHVDFRNADIRYAKFREDPSFANTPGLVVDSYARGLTQSQVEEAKNWQEAELPDYLLQNRPIEEVREVGEQESEKSA